MQTPSYRKGKTPADSKNSVPAEGPGRLACSTLPLCPAAKGEAHKAGCWGPEAKLPPLLTSTASVPANCTCAIAGAVSAAGRNLPVYLPVHWDFLWLLGGEFSRKRLGSIFMS